MEGAAPRRTLHDMLGLDPHAPIDELRAAYERAMSRATRSGDHKLAVSLSRAYDELPRDKRARIYDVPDRLFGAPSVSVLHERARRRSGTARRSGVAPRRSRRRRSAALRRRRSGTWKRRLALVAVVVVLGGALAGYVVVYR